MVSMVSIHFFRWTEQLKDAGFDVYWFDVVDGGKKIERINWVYQIVGWKLKWDYPGRHFVKAKFPKLYKFIQKFNENDVEKQFDKLIKEIQPDIVHSFALYVACTPILNTMQKHKEIPWVYSSWGSDLFYYKNIPAYLKDIQTVLKRVNYLFTDCLRDSKIAFDLGFNGEFLGVFPGGGGFDLELMEQLNVPSSQRKTILIKGYEGRSGRAINVLKAIEQLKETVVDYNIVVFGASKPVFTYVETSELKNWSNISVYGNLARTEVLTYMGKSLLYIGNSNSDGLPNTLLEALCLGAFPIQSNPGGVTEEVIINGKNGYLIEDCEKISEIKSILEKTIIEAKFKNTDSFPKIDYDFKNIQQQVISIYEHKII